MKFKTQATLSAVAIAVVSGFSVQAANFDELEPGVLAELQLPVASPAIPQPAPVVQQADSFTQYLNSQKIDTSKTDRVIVKFHNQQMSNALMQSATILDNSYTAQAAANAPQASNYFMSQASQMMTSLKAQMNENVTVVGQGLNGEAIMKFDHEMAPAEMNKMVSMLNQNPNVASAEWDPIRKALAQTQPWGIGRVQADQVSDAQAGNKTVCVIDSGYDITNSDLSGNQVAGTNDSGTGQWSVPGGSHGSHVAGTIAALNNNEGVVGVLPNGKIDLHIIKVFTEAGYAYSSDLATAISRCQDAGADVVNMSLGGGGSSTAERNAMQAFTNAGMLLVAASGNDGNTTLSYPASYDAVMAVGALDEGNQHAEFSQFTPQVEVSAPGEAVLSTVGVGDGRQGYLSYGSVSLGDDRVVPHNRFDNTSGSFVINNFNATVTGDLAACTTSGSTYNCGNMTNRICVVERIGNQIGSTYPDGEAAQACADAGASAVVVYSNSARPGLQNPFMVDRNNRVRMPTVSVNRATGQALAAAAGQSATLETRANTDYAYFNGTSMATPHVAGVAALAWSQNPDCTAAQVRQALKDTALDVGAAGRDDKTGYGLVQAKAASDELATVCGSNSGGGGTTPPAGNALQNGVAKTGISVARNAEVRYTFEVPAGATDLNFVMAGGTGDADLYVRAGAEPTTSTYDCRPFRNGNSESCPVATVQPGTYHVMIRGYAASSGVSLTASFTAPSNGGGGATPPQGGTASVDNISATRGNWKYYTMDIPAGMSTLKVTTSGGTGDADLYVRFGSRPTTSTYDCRPFRNGNAETCNQDNPQEGVWHIGVRAYATFSGVKLDVEYQP